MPYVLTRDTATAAHLRAWPHNALNPRGFFSCVNTQVQAYVFASRDPDLMAYFDALAH